MKGALDKDGYTKIVLMHEGRRVDKQLHTIVLETFRGPRPEGCWGLHRDDNKTNNTISNLRWAPYHENYKDWLRNGGSRRGSRSGMSKLVEKQVKWARQVYEAGRLNSYEIAEVLGVSRSAVNCFLRRETWTHV